MTVSSVLTWIGFQAAEPFFGGMAGRTHHRGLCYALGQGGGDQQNGYLIKYYTNATMHRLLNRRNHAPMFLMTQGTHMPALRHHVAA